MIGHSLFGNLLLDIKFFKFVFAVFVFLLFFFLSQICNLRGDIANAYYLYNLFVYAIRMHTKSSAEDVIECFKMKQTQMNVMCIHFLQAIHVSFYSKWYLCKNDVCTLTFWYIFTLGRLKMNPQIRFWNFGIASGFNDSLLKHFFDVAMKQHVIVSYWCV